MFKCIYLFVLLPVYGALADKMRNQTSTFRIVMCCRTDVAAWQCHLLTMCVPRGCAVHERHGDRKPLQQD